MFRLIKLIFWVFTIIILAYFVADLKIAGKNIKQRVDEFLASPTHQKQIKQGIGNLIQKVDGLLESKIENKIKTTKQENTSIQPSPTENHLEQDSTQALENIIKKNQ
ncbi:MAG: hypothetical protein A3G32_08390 [Deltaproteobacteria bacterium RIFCSPLOWO2_12_FULL_40_28]|nr:MAG: hypothetical protein A3C45_01090 [Deltaproteobacteria bacterium RIFCSPHIGHO2_02_FULL_40_28]OGQ20927.1 MAG: hypothetical protein A3E27_03755 [Deltaproteobacteria bacterium RIFCSPHIGHO2_12_FULL_40_32]OGQ39328.1 MAG: hypothetical protein A3I69_05115 [Deltaproteobacteria bacterium RIFCSPLOWO2_02_FULL_40_36]OGQ54609.1 MAG: hypothetical protein A3G32_08390 [Deltaproteobacteria bacterium RIFCSPLOWO2_12_FULL_40_28]